MKKIYIGAVFVLLLATGSLILLKARLGSIVINQAQLDGALQRAFPITTTNLIIFRVTYSHPSIQLVPQSNLLEIGLRADVGIRPLGESSQLAGKVVVRASPDYRSALGELYLSNLQVVHLGIDGVPEQYTRTVTSLVSTTARSYLESYPVYKVPDYNMVSAVAKRFVKRVDVRENGVCVTFGY